MLHTETIKYETVIGYLFINLFVPGMRFKKCIFHSRFTIGIFRYFYDNAIRWMPRDLTDNKSTLVQVMVLVQFGNKSLPEPILTQFNVAIWRH